MPEFATPLAYQQAQSLMQPALIRVIDNIRKQLDCSDWVGTYEDQVIWPVETTPEQKQQYLDLQAQLETASPEAYDPLQASLNQLPAPQHLYTLCLEKQGQQHRVNLWHLCYQICSLQDYTEENPDPLEIDQTLFDPETGDIDWMTLDTKALRLVSAIFTTLPS